MRYTFLLKRFLSFLVLVALCVSVTEGLIFFSSMMARSPLTGLENQIIDLAFQVRKKNNLLKQYTTDDIVIIDIDDASIEALGRPQLWPRSFDAAAIYHVNSGEPLAIGIDYLYTERDALPEVYTQMLEARGVENASEILHSLSSDDSLAQVIFESKKVYLGLYDDDAKYDIMMDTNDLGYLRMIMGTLDSTLLYPMLSHPVLPIPEFSATAKAVGTISMPTTQDGTVRQYHLLHEIPLDFGVPMYIANFPLYMAIDALGIVEDSVILEKSRLTLNEAINIPLSSDATFRINWPGNEESIRYISFHKVVDGRIPSEFFKDKFVFFGTSASGMQDLKTVPSKSSKMPGVEIHAIAFLNIMNNAFLKDYNQQESRPWLILASFFLCLLFLTLKPIFGFITSLLLVFGELFFYVLYLMPEFNLIIPIVSFMLLTLLSYILSSLYIYFIRERSSRRLKYAFGTYVSPEVVEQITKDASRLQLGGEKKELTVLFSDIRGFTSYSEKLDPQEIVAMLNDYLSRMSNVILHHRGTIDKFIGDAIMAIFGAPIFQKDHATRACYVALEMIEELEEFNRIQKEKNGEPLSIGIGINTGDMTVGNIGSAKRFDYTVIGDAVNLGSRLESLTKFFGVNVLVSQRTKDAVLSDRFIFRELSSVVVKGKAKPVVIFELMDRFENRENHRSFIEEWNLGLTAYKEKRFIDAGKHFEQCHEWRENDVATGYYIGRIAHCIMDPKEWSDVIVLDKK